jgi:hypothetical protein
VTAPNVLLAGAARSGTTALASYLGQHPSIQIAAHKEPHFLAFWPDPPSGAGPGDADEMARQAVTTPEAYLALWGDAPVRVDASVTTLYHSERAMRNAAELCPDHRVVVVLRNPIDRAFSAYWYQRNRGYETLDFLDALDAEPERIAAGWYHMWRYVDVGRYGRQITAVLGAIESERLLVLDFADVFVDRNPRVMSRLHEFVGIPDAAACSLRLDRENSSGVPHGALGRLTATAARSQTLRRTVRAVMPRRLAERARSRGFARPQMADSTRRRLADVFAPDVEALCAITGQDFRHWMVTDER